MTTVRTLIFFRTLLCWVGQYDATKKKSPETGNNRPDWGNSGGNTRLPAQGSSEGAACHRGSGSHLLAQGNSGATQDSSGGTAAPVPTAQLWAAPGPTRVLWTPAPASLRKPAPGAPHVPMAPGRMKTVELSCSENKAPDEFYFFSTRRPAQGSSGGSTCPRGSGPNENRRADAEDLAEPGRCKATPIRSKRNRAQGAAADSYRIDPDPICGGPAVADWKVVAARLATRGAGGGAYRRQRRWRRPSRA
jgi:hypothetical protein